MAKAGENSLKSLIFLLASIMAMSPLAIDLYLPAMPVMASELATTMPVMQNTLSIYLLGYACGLVLFGPLSDIRPRRTMVIMGISGFLVCSFAQIFCQTIELFFVLRFVQAFIISSALVVIPATIKEYYGVNTAKGLSYVSMVMMLAPMIAPAIGSILLAVSGWQLIFIALTAYALTMLGLVIRFMPEKKQRQVQPQSLAFFRRYHLVFSRQKARVDLMTSMAVSLAFFAYITAIPFVYLSVYQTSEFTFSALFGSAVFALMTAHFINTRLVGKVGSRAMLNGGLLVALIFSTALVLVTVSRAPISWFVTALLPLMGSLSIIAANADALVYSRFKQHLGTATAVIGVLRFGVGALAGPIMAFFHNGSATVFAALMFSCIALIVLFQLPANLKRMRYRHTQQVFKQKLKAQG
ncbi:multidrug effflux MFS transporter [Thalassotalea sp. LPB0316]|uniref:multidrug effflux MFS transporter n=1 Tax=Thalassotalea sp. LPB0316 TaxID=2769490 RepID=UPI0018670849|nr:multidrug effflux MFS transporter [Thalassotalea sp. LPB0316]QOL26671.1 multidrug effflux MFS transporter [Thalassotalea sp. LPB0316]